MCHDSKSWRRSSLNINPYLKRVGRQWWRMPVIGEIIFGECENICRLSKREFRCLMLSQSYKLREVVRPLLEWSSDSSNKRERTVSRIENILYFLTPNTGDGYFFSFEREKITELIILLKSNRI
jgi:hypothetical protein